MSSIGERIQRPATSEDIEADIAEVERFLQSENFIVSGTSGPLKQLEDLSQIAYIPQLDTVFGTDMVSKDGRIVVDPKPIDRTSNGNIRGTNSESSTDCSGSNLVTLQLVGTWAGTVTFECTSDGGNWVGIVGYRSTDGNAVQSTTSNGIFRFNSSGLSRIRIRWSTFTSGSVNYYWRVSCNGNSPIGLAPSFSSGSGYSLTTTDYTISNSLVTPQYGQILKITPISQSIPTSYVSNFLGSIQQIYTRLRTEAGGDQRQAFAQKPNTYEMLTCDENVNKWMEKISYQLNLVILLIMKAYNIGLPEGWENLGEYK